MKTIQCFRTELVDNKVKIINVFNFDIIISDDPNALLNFLWEQEDDSLLAFWGLDASIAPVLELLGEDKCQKLVKTAHCFIRPFSLFYISSKVFSITRGKPKTSYYGLSTFYPDIDKEPEDIVYYAEKLLKAFNKLGLEPSKLTSPIAVYEQAVLRHLSLPDVHSIPVEAALLAYQCSGRLWTEAHQIGYWN